MLDLPKDLPDALKDQPLWRAISTDPDLFPEYRPTATGPSFTVYYRGAALLRELRILDGRLQALQHVKYVPMGDPKSPYVTVVDGADGLGFRFDGFPDPLPLAAAEPETLRRYKAQVVAQNGTGNREGRLVEALCRSNRVVDQEIVLPCVEEGSDRIDLAVARRDAPRVVLVEVKRVDDARLYAPPGRAPEVVEQLMRYVDAVERHQIGLASRFADAVAAKRQVGVGDFAGWGADSRSIAIEPRVVLAIGGCDRGTVRSIQSGEGVWEWVTDDALRSNCDVRPFGSQLQLFP